MFINNIWNSGQPLPEVAIKTMCLPLDIAHRWKYLSGAVTAKLRYVWLGMLDMPVLQMLHDAAGSTV